MPKHLSRHLMTLLTTALIFLVGCGQKGPLYLDKKEIKQQENHSNHSNHTNAPEQGQTKNQ